MLAKARPAREVLPKIFGTRTAAAMLKPAGGPKSPDSKDTISLRQCLVAGDIMSSTLEALEAEALQLSAAERAQLVERLIASLDVDPEIEEAWAAEVERRNAEIESGAFSLVSGPEALAKLKAEFR